MGFAENFETLFPSVDFVQTKAVPKKDSLDHIKQAMKGQKKTTHSFVLFCGEINAKTRYSVILQQQQKQQQQASSTVLYQKLCFQQQQKQRTPSQ